FLQLRGVQSLLPVQHSRCSHIQPNNMRIQTRCIQAKLILCIQNNNGLQLQPHNHITMETCLSLITWL
ncbi:unnamed protein product, partial [Candidula unifasciata]